MPFPLADGTGSPVLEEIVGGPAAALTAVALVVGPGARASGWGARAAIALAERWRGPRRVLLADLDLEHPALHDLVGVANDEGVIDLVDYGISLGRLIRSAAGGRYDLLSAGIFTPTPGEILRHDGWSRVLLEVAARRGTLLAWVPVDADGAASVIDRAGAVLVLAEADEARSVVERLAHPYAVLAILTPESPAAEPALDAAEPAFAIPGSVEPAAPAATRVPDPGMATAQPTAAAPPALEPAIPEPGGQERDDIPAGSAVEAGVMARDEPVFTMGDEVAAEEVALQDVAATDIAAEDVAMAAAAAEAAAAEDVAMAAAAAEAAAAETATPKDPTEDRAAADPAAADVAAARSGAGAPSERAADVPITVAPLGRLSDEEFERIRLPRDPVAREALIAELRDRQRAARLAGAAPAASLLDEDAASAADRDRSDAARVSAAAAVPGATAPAGGAAGGETGRRRTARTESDMPVTVPLVERPRTPPRRSKRFMRPLLWTVGVVLLASLLAGAWHFLGGRLRPVEPAVVAEPEPAPAAPPAPVVQNALPYVVAIEAHRDLLTAAERVIDLEEMEPGLLFHVETLERQGVLFYHVMAGPVPDSAAALALRDTLIARGHKTGPTPTDVRATPLAFLVGDYATREVADQQREVLHRLDIPGYVLQGRAADDQPLYRLYVGGFGTEAEADVVGQLLRAAGIRDSLVTRTGSTIVTDSLVTPTDSSNP